MQKSDNNQVGTNAHRRVKASTTLNRKYVKRPEVSSSVAIRRTTDIKALKTSVDTKMRARTMDVQTAPKLSAKELKEQAIKKALASAERMNEPAQEQPKMAAAIMKNATEKKTKKAGLKSQKVKFGMGRVMLALACTAVAVFAIVYFVNMNMPDISLKVAAMQTGIEASYPSYVPRDFSLSDITSESGKITLNFRNGSTGDAFSLVEEKSSWDSNALLANFVKGNYGDDYTVVREQGLTLYINGSNACWVNGGIVFKITTTSGSLTKKQIRSIATSL